MLPAGLSFSTRDRGRPTKNDLYFRRHWRRNSTSPRARYAKSYATMIAVARNGRRYRRRRIMMSLKAPSPRWSAAPGSLGVEQRECAGAIGQQSALRNRSRPLRVRPMRLLRASPCAPRGKDQRPSGPSLAGRGGALVSRFQNGSNVCSPESQSLQGFPCRSHLGFRTLAPQPTPRNHSQPSRVSTIRVPSGNLVTLTAPSQADFGCQFSGTRRSIIVCVATAMRRPASSQISAEAVA